MYLQFDVTVQVSPSISINRISAHLWCAQRSILTGDETCSIIHFSVCSVCFQSYIVLAINSLICDFQQSLGGMGDSSVTFKGCV